MPSCGQCHGEWSQIHPISVVELTTKRGERMPEEGVRLKVFHKPYLALWGDGEDPASGEGVHL